MCLVGLTPTPFQGVTESYSYKTPWISVDSPYRTVRLQAEPFTFIKSKLRLWIAKQSPDNI